MAVTQSPTATVETATVSTTLIVAVVGIITVSGADPGVVP